MFAKTLRDKFRQVRKKIIRLWRMNAAIPRLLRYNPYTGFIGRKLFYYVPFLLPHDKSYYGFMHLVHTGDGLFLDVGANDGISAIGFRHIHSDYRIISVEPNPCHERSLRKVKRVLKRFDYLMLGAGRARSQMTLFIPIYNGVPIYTAASLNREYVLTTMMEQHLPGANDKNIVIFECKVDVMPLDELGLTPDIIKIDTEGFDYEVLLGLRKTIENCRPSLLIEHNPALMGEVGVFFKELGYELLTYDYTKDKFALVDEAGKNKLLPQREKITTNVFCVPKERVKGLPHFIHRA
jgi:FkbM family methyltransferase